MPSSTVALVDAALRGELPEAQANANFAQGQEVVLALLATPASAPQIRPIKVESHPDVVWFLKNRCNVKEQDEFYTQLDAVRTQPLAYSEAVFHPKLSRYMLRFFRFGRNLAIFQYDPGKDRIRVLECRKVPPKRASKEKADDPP